MLITDLISSFEVTAPECIQLELKFNVTSKGREWIHIGDHLFAYGTSQSNQEILCITNEQYEFLRVLQTLTTNECYAK